MTKSISLLDQETSVDNADSFVFADVSAGRDKRITAENLLEALGGASESYVDDKALLLTSFFNVREFGAMGDGVTDDSDAIIAAISEIRARGGGKIFFPKGTYMISKTLYLPSNIHMVGEGLDLTIIKNRNNAQLDSIVPWESHESLTENIERYRWRTMIATDGSHWEVDENVENGRIEDIGFDWNDLEIGSYSACPVMIGSANNFHLKNVKIFDALPPDLGSENRWRGVSVLFQFSENCSISYSWIGASDYESVMVRYLSRSIHIHHNNFYIQKPPSFRNQSHAMQLAVPSIISGELDSEFGYHKPGPVFCYRNKVTLVSNVAHAFTSHTGRGFYVEYNDIESIQASTPWIIKPFDGTEDVRVTGNRIDITKSQINPNGFSAINLDAGVGNAPCREVVISQNKIFLNFTGSGYSELDRRPIIGGLGSQHFEVTISDNEITIYDYSNQPFICIGFSGQKYSVHGNRISFNNSTETITEDGPIAMFLGRFSVDGAAVNNNHFFSPFQQVGKGIILDDSFSISRLLITNNTVPRSVGTRITDDHPDQSGFIVDNNMNA